MTLDQKLSIAAACVNIAAIVIAGGWTVYLFFVRHEAEPFPDIDLKHSVLPYSDSSRLLLVTICVSNSGTRALWPIEQDGITLSIKTLPVQAEIGTIVHFNHGEYLLHKTDVIKDANPDYEMEGFGYHLMPRSSYRELLPVVAPAGALVMAKAEIRTKGGAQIWIYKIWKISDFPMSANQAMGQTENEGSSSV